MFFYASFVAVVVVGQVGDSGRYDDMFGEQTEATQTVESRQDDAALDFGSQQEVSPPPHTESQDPYAVPRSTAAEAEVSDSDQSAISQVDRTKPSELMRSMLTAPDNDRLTGTPITMEELIVGSTSREEQLRRINAYWDLCSSIADYYLGLREQDELRQWKSRVSIPEQTLQQAETELGVRVGIAERAAIASQHRLANLMRRADQGFLPLPGDNPHCGDYYTRFDQVFAGRSSREAEQLSELLPLRYEELKDATATVAQSEQRLNAIESGRISAGDDADTLGGLELLALRRRAFVQLVRDYNQRIARYAELAAPGPIDANLLIGMLIKRNDTGDSAASSADTGSTSTRQGQTAASTPRSTFSEGWTPVDERRQNAALRDDSVEQASGELEQSVRREHSLLVPAE